MINIYTSYFGRLRKIPKDIIPISIAIYNPSWSGCKSYIHLAPSANILHEWREKQNVELYTERYNNEILSNLSPNKILEDLSAISGNKDVVLLCYETQEKFCHRHLVSKRFNTNGILCQELL